MIAEPLSLGSLHSLGQTLLLSEALEVEVRVGSELTVGLEETFEQLEGELISVFVGDAPKVADDHLAA